MTSPGSVAVAEHDDPRDDGPMTGGERVVLDHRLDVQQSTRHDGHLDLLREAVDGRRGW